MDIIIKITLQEDESPVSLARQCRGDSDCPWPISTECPIGRMGIMCDKVKADDWKKAIKTELVYNGV